MAEQIIERRRVVVAHYSEIALKGRNRPRYERQLVRNIKSLLPGSGLSLRVKDGRVVIYLSDSEGADQVSTIVGRVLGVRWYGEGVSLPRDLAALREEAVRIAKTMLEPDTTFKVVASRADKSYQMNSLEIERELGAAIAEKTGSKVDLKNPSQRFYVEVLRDEALLIWKRYEGLGGLPVGCSGKVLSLLSGGIDSPVAAWLLMKRGCNVDFLHFYALPSPSHVRGSKISSIASILNTYGLRCRLYLAPFHVFMSYSMKGEPRLELTLFRRFMMRVASEFAKRNGYLGIVTGDSLGQVASQTLENIAAASSALDLPVYRPLIGMDKEEIIALAKKIGTYEASIMEYKDCCSIISRNVATKSSKAIIDSEWSRLNLDAAVEEALNQIEEVDIGSPQVPLRF